MERVRVAALLVIGEGGFDPEPMLWMGAAIVRLVESARCRNGVV